MGVDLLQTSSTAVNFFRNFLLDLLGSFVKLEVHFQQATVLELVVLLHDIFQEAVLFLLVLSGDLGV